MITLDDILDTTCETIGFEKELITDKRKINQDAQLTRTVYCRKAREYGFGYHAIGKKINRKPQNAYYYVKKAPITGIVYKTAMVEVQLKLNGK